MKQKILFILCVLGIILTGCEIFTYVIEPEVPSSPTETSNPPTATLPVPSATLAFPPTFTSTPSESTPTSTIAVAGDLPIQTFTYTLQDGNPIYLENFAHPESGCDWMGVAGQVFSTEGIEVKNLIIVVGDAQTTEEHQWSDQTGQAVFYGPGGYEIQFSDTSLETTDRFWVQVIDQAGVPLSDRNFFGTKNNCSENLVLMNFVAIETDLEKGMPTPTLEVYP